MTTRIKCLTVSFFALAAGCSSLDPAAGKWHVDQPVTEDAGGETEVDAADDSVIDPNAISFARDIRPLMDRGAPMKGDTATPKGCKPCHYATQTSHTGLDLGGLDLTTLGALRKGGGSSGRRIVVPGKPEESVILQALRGQYGFSARMPKNGNFWPAEEIELVERWIADGARGGSDE